MKAIRLSLLACVMGIGLSGCNSTSVSLSDVIIAPPLPVQYQHEAQLSRLNSFLQTDQITREQRALLLYERGVVYDRLGLKSLAHLDFNQAIQLKPDLAEAYNFLGVYLTLSSNFDSAYEAFDSANDLKPTYQFAFFSRGIALYYGDRASLARDDMDKYLAFKPDDPYRIIWQYIVQSKSDPEAAKASLRANAVLSPKDHWATRVIELFLGELSEKQFLQSLGADAQTERERAEQLCEAYFYLGKHMSHLGEQHKADIYYRLTLATNVHDFIEHKYARLELEMRD